LPIIDFRLRPPALGFLASRIYAAPDNRDSYTRRLGFPPVISAQRQSMDLLRQEMDAAGVSTGVVVGRTTATLGTIANADVAAIVAADPKRFVGVGSVDPLRRREAFAELEAMRKLGLRAVNIEPGVLSPATYMDDRRLYPFYAWCEDNRLPVIVMSGGGAGPDITYSAPERIDRVLADFPELTMVSSHGNWPWVHEILSIAFRRPNLYLCPDMYWPSLPGSEDYTRAANSFLSERMLFGTAYPFCPLGEYVRWFTALPLSSAAMENVLWRNAARVLGLDAKT
jgi:predicted TIM-barrel fold metal-dependent hydrolase